MTRRVLVWVWLFVFTVGVGPAGAELTPKARAIVRHIAIQHNGRHKPLDSFAREILKFVTGSSGTSRVVQEGPVETLLSILVDPERWQESPLIAVPFVPLREALGLDPETTHVSYNEVIATRTLMRRLPALAEKQQQDETFSMLDNETWDVYQRFVALNRLFEHELELVPSNSITSESWLPILKPTGYPPEQQQQLRNTWSMWITTLRDGEAQEIEVAAAQLADRLQAVNPSAYPARWRLRLEVAYNDLNPFRWAQLAYLVAVLGFIGRLAGWRRLLGFGTVALWAGFLVHGAGILLRVILGGRPPVSNFYETMLWLPFVAVLLALIFGRIYRSGYFGLAAAILAGITLLLADHVPLDSSITPVVAVLRSTLWLTIHVLMIVASYGAFALATVLAHIYGWLYLIRPGAHAVRASLDTFLYRTIQVGVVLLAGGVMLGAVWANASWGRYWGWDPKETWALITLLWFLAVLHGRFAGWLHGLGVALSTIGGFLLLLMTYYGVSFYLVGLHSYAGGNAKPLPTVLVAYLIAEAIFMLTLGLAALRRRRRPLQS